MEIDFKNYVNMESEMFKGKTSKEIVQLLHPAVSQGIRTRHLLIGLSEQIKEVKELIIKNIPERIPELHTCGNCHSLYDMSLNIACPKCFNKKGSHLV